MPFKMDLLKYLAIAGEFHKNNSEIKLHTDFVMHINIVCVVGDEPLKFDSYCLKLGIFLESDF